MLMLDAECQARQAAESGPLDNESSANCATREVLLGQFILILLFAIAILLRAMTQ